MKITPRHLYLAVGVAGSALALLGVMRGVDPIFLIATVIAVVSLALYGAVKLRQSETELRESADMFRGAFEDTSLATVLTDLDHRFLRVNAAFAKLFGHTETEMLNMSMADLTHPDDMPESLARRQHLLTGRGAHFQMEKRYRHRDGHLIWGLVNVALVRDAAGKPLRYVGQVQDITERKRAEDDVRRAREELETRVQQRTAELEAANKELEAFSYSVSHDLRAPLRAIDGFARILQTDYLDPLPPDGRELLHDVRANTQRMGNLVDDLLRFSRLSRQPLRQQSIDCGDVVRNCLDELRRECDGRRIEFKVGELPACHGDPALLKQVWFNLIGNAIKYTARCPEAVIEIASRPGEQPAEIVYFVKDNGVGFDMRYAQKLFGVFQRLHRAEDYDGTGVGLAIVQRIVLRHGGRVWADAEPGRGATFSFTLGGGSAHEQ